MTDLKCLQCRVAKLRTDLDSATMIAHCGAQLAQFDWESGGQIAEVEAAVLQWTFRDERGNAWRGVLLALPWPTSRTRQFVSFVVEELHGYADLH
jgi:hypothetical protein